MNLANYFKNNKAFDRLLNLLKKKYISIGRFSGTVVISNITKEESVAFSDFFCKSYRVGSTVKISFKDIERANRGTIYEDTSWQELFDSYFKEKVITKKEERDIKNKEDITYFNDLSLSLDSKEKMFLNDILNDRDIFSIILKRYHKEKNTLKNDLKYLINFCVYLDKYIPLSLVMLASKSGNPHFLDVDNLNGKLFIKMLCKYYQKDFPTNATERLDFFNSLGISVDLVSNFCITYNLTCDKKYLNDFYNAKEIVNLNLSNLYNINLSSSKNRVFIFENPSLIEYLHDLDESIIITYGMPNICVYKIIDILIKNNNEIYYNGDFDPEGLLIANILKNKYPSIELFCYTKDDYFNSLSDNTLNNNRISKLNKVDVTQLEEVKKLIIKEKLCAYQENNIDNIKKYIIEKRAKI